MLLSLLVVAVSVNSDPTAIVDKFSGASIFVIDGAGGAGTSSFLHEVVKREARVRSKE